MPEGLVALVVLPGEHDSGQCARNVVMQHPPTLDSENFNYFLIQKLSYFDPFNCKMLSRIVNVQQYLKFYFIFFRKSFPIHRERKRFCKLHPKYFGLIFFVQNRFMGVIIYHRSRLGLFMSLRSLNMTCLLFWVFPYYHFWILSRFCKEAEFVLSTYQIPTGHRQPTHSILLKF